MDQKKNILITGASGMLGRAFSTALKGLGYTVFNLQRNVREEPFYYLENTGFIFLDPSIPLHAVINLAGKNISEERWSTKTKRLIVDSRVQTTSLVCRALAKLPVPPKILLSASAIGYYGTNEEKTFDESSPAGNDFLSILAQSWESATMPAQEAGIRTTFLRFGLVLSPTGGVLKNLILPFRAATVGVIGSGKQTMSWISLSDAVQIMLALLRENGVSGPVNLVSGHIVTNREFAHCLKKSINRLKLPRIPSAIVRLMFGEMADAALLPSSSVSSLRIKELGIELQHPELQNCLTDILKQ